jgi:hypothetical protein
MPPAQLAANASIRFFGTTPGQIVIAAICFLLGVLTLSAGHNLVGGGLIVATLCLAGRVAVVLRRLPPPATDEEELTAAPSA